jgi:hypothetical protein
VNELNEPESLSPAVVESHAVAANYKSSMPHDAKQLRVEHIGRLLDSAYQSASTLKLSKEEQKQLRADFPDDAVQTRPHDGIIYISHMALRERLWDVFGPGHVSEICRERMVRTDSNEIAVDLVLLIRGSFVAEGIGTAKYYPNNPKGSFGDTVESAWSDALRRCCKKFGVGVQVWRPEYIKRITDERATKRQEKREEKLVFTKGKRAPVKDPDWPDAPAMTNPPEDNIPF